MKKCPVCKSKKLKKQEYFCDHIMLEEYIECEICSFHFEFVHGNTRYYFGKYIFSFGWSESNRKLNKRHKVMNERIKKHSKIVKHLYKLKW